MGALVGATLIAVMVGVLLWPYRNRSLPTGGRDPLDLGAALTRLAVERHRGITTNNTREPVAEEAHVRVLTRHDRHVYDWHHDPLRRRQLSTADDGDAQQPIGG